MSNVISQKDAVFNAVTEVLGSFNGAVTLTTDQRKEVIATVMSGFVNKTVEISAEASAKYDTETKLKSYTQGLVSNWLRKDVRLNGGEKHTTKNPGSRVGSGDNTIKALRTLRKTLTDESQIAEVESEIETRLAAIKAEKKPKVEINAKLIPDNLQHLIG